MKGVFPTNIPSIYSARPNPGFLLVSSVANSPFQMPRLIHGVKSIAVWRFLSLSALNRLRKRTPDSKNCLLKPCLIKRHFRWLLGESTDGRQKREAVKVRCQAKGLFQRRACRLAGLSLPTCRYLG